MRGVGCEGGGEDGGEGVEGCAVRWLVGGKWGDGEEWGGLKRGGEEERKSVDGDGDGDGGAYGGGSGSDFRMEDWREARAEVSWARRWRV